MRRDLDVGGVLLVASRVSGLDAEEVLADANVGVLVMLTGRARVPTPLADAAAELLVGIAASRPFAVDNAAIAWASAVQLLALNDLRITVEADLAVELVTRAAAGNVDEREAARRLSEWIGRPLGLTGRVVACLTRPRPPAPSLMQRMCPVCGLVVAVAPGRSTVFRAEPSPRDVVADCAHRNRTHTAEGRPLHRVPDELDERIATLTTAMAIRAAVMSGG